MWKFQTSLCTFTKRAPSSFFRPSYITLIYYVIYEWLLIIIHIGSKSIRFPLDHCRPLKHHLTGSSAAWHRIAKTQKFLKCCRPKNFRGYHAPLHTWINGSFCKVVHSTPKMLKLDRGRILRKLHFICSNVCQSVFLELSFGAVSEILWFIQFLLHGIPSTATFFKISFSPTRA